MSLFNSTVLDNIASKLLLQKSTIAAAESVTSGLLQNALSTASKALEFFQGGITVYNLGQKFRHLNVEPIHAQSVNCVSQTVADQMALGVCTSFHSDWGLSVTGYATPVPESQHLLFAYYSIAFQGKVKASGRLDADGGDSSEVQLYYTNQILERLIEVL